MPCIKATDITDAKWGLVSDQVLEMTGNAGSVVFRAQYERDGLRCTAFFEPHEVLDVLNAREDTTK